MIASLRFSCVLLLVAFFSGQLAEAVENPLGVKLGQKRGLIALVGSVGEPEEILHAANDDRTIYVQSDDAKAIRKLQTLAEQKGLLGTRIFAVVGDTKKLHLGSNLADVVVSPRSGRDITEQEVLRILRPRGLAYFGTRTVHKPVPEGIDEWSHPYHGPDNNPQSTDRYVRGEFRTQFLAYPKFSPMPEQTVIAGGRIYKAMGHIAHKANQNAMLNTLLCVNAYNGTILWQKKNPPGFMIHRNTMIASEEGLFLGEHESCKLLDAETGEVVREYVVPKELADGPTWKWMAMEDGVLYALVGNREIKVDTQKSNRRGLGHWPWGMWQGHDYGDPNKAFGFGRTLIAFDVKTKKILWHYRDKEFLDARGICMNKGRLFAFSPEKYLVAIDKQDGSVLFKNSDKDLLAAIGPNGRAQHYVTGYATTCYIKCNEHYLFFAGPQRAKMVSASASSGRLAWTHPAGNLQLVLRDDAVYAAGPNTTGVRLDYATGKTISGLPTRRACTRATGCVDSIFYRTSGGTVRVMTETQAAHHIAPMRPPCQDGVIISNGQLYWGPWMCGCQLSLYGHVSLAPVGDATFGDDVYDTALSISSPNQQVSELKVAANDWPSYRGSNARNDVTQNTIPAKVELAWTQQVSQGALPTAPVAAGGLVFVANRAGAVHAFSAEGKTIWKSYTNGPIYYPPAIDGGRLFVGCADGHVYAFEAKTGRALWDFRVAPEDRLVPIFDQAISTWPVAGGVAVQNGTVYAAAGFTHYDGTYVVALDGATGKLKAKNLTSGKLSPKVNSGISLQGNLSIVNNELRFLAGGVYEVARYDLATLKCLNTPKVQVNSQFRTAFYPYYPEYGKYVSLEHTCPDGSTLCHDASYEGNQFSNLALQEPLPAGASRSPKEAARWNRRRGETPIKSRWQDNGNRRFTSFVVSKDNLLAAGHSGSDFGDVFLASLNVKDGRPVWTQKLKSLPVKGGVAIDAELRIFVTDESGKLLCFRGK